MTGRRFRRLICMVVVLKVVLYLPSAAKAHHGLGGVAASVLLDAALSSEGGCTETTATAS